MSSEQNCAIGAGASSESNGEDVESSPRYESNPIYSAFPYFGHTPAGNSYWVPSIELFPGIHEWICDNVCGDIEAFINKRKDVLINTLLKEKKKELLGDRDEHPLSGTGLINDFLIVSRKSSECLKQVNKVDNDFKVVVDKHGVSSLGPAPAGMPSISANF